MNELYEELETPEGERKISRIAKAKDLTKNNQTKDEQRVVLGDLHRIMGRWKGFLISCWMERITDLTLRIECQMMV